MELSMTFENPKLNEIVGKKLTKLKKSKVNVEEILDNIQDKINEKYSVSRTQYSIRIKLDKRKNQNTVIHDIQDILNNIDVPFDIEYLFSVIHSSNEIIIRARRKR